MKNTRFVYFLSTLAHEWGQLILKARAKLYIAIKGLTGVK
jgi:hypothetical protein